MHAYFAKLCNRLKYVTSKLKILKSKFENLKKLKKHSNFMSEFQFYISFRISVVGFPS